MTEQLQRGGRGGRVSPVVPRSSKGKKFPPPKRVRHVEQFPCTTGGLHELTNLGPVTLCSGCLLDWQTLDGELNGRLATRGEG